MTLLHLEGLRCTAAHMVNIKMTKLVSSTGLFSSYFRWLHLPAPEQTLEPAAAQNVSRRSGRDPAVRNTAQASHSPQNEFICQETSRTDCLREPTGQTWDISVKLSKSWHK